MLAIALAAAGWVYGAVLDFALSGGRESFLFLLTGSPDAHALYERLGFLFLLIATGFTVAWMAGRRLRWRNGWSVPTAPPSTSSW